MAFGVHTGVVLLSHQVCFLGVLAMCVSIGMGSFHPHSTPLVYPSRWFGWNEIWAGLGSTTCMVLFLSQSDGRQASGQCLLVLFLICLLLFSPAGFSLLLNC